MDKTVLKIGIKTLHFLLWFILPLFAGSTTSFGFSFLNTIYSARMSALGGGYPASWGDISGQLVNPAGLAFVENRQFSLNFADYLLDLKGGSLNFVQPLNGFGSVGICLLYFDYGKISEIDRYGVPTGNNFVPKDFAVVSSFSNYLSNQLSYGVNLKYGYSQIDRYSAKLFAADFGLLFRMSFLDNLVFGAVLRNFGKNYDPYNEKLENLPLKLSAGFSKRFFYLPLTFHFGWNYLFDNQNSTGEGFENVALGVEYVHSNYLKLRLGYNNHLRNNLEDISPSGLSGFSAGFGLKLSGDCLDYSYSNYGGLGNTHRFSFTFNLKHQKIREKTDKVVNLTNLNEKLQPHNLKYTIVGDKLFISWQGVEGATYDVYGKLHQVTDWVLLNSAHLHKNYIRFQKPRTKGVYLFKISALIKERVITFSGELRVDVR